VWDLFLDRRDLTQGLTWDGPNAPALQRLPLFTCPSSPVLPNRFPGTNYLWCTGSRIETGGCNNVAMGSNGVFADDQGRKIADLLDGTSNTIMASEYIPGYNLANGFKRVASITVANRSFPTQAELDVVAAAAAVPSGTLPAVLTNNGQGWAWHTHTNALFNTSAPPNWKCQNGAGGAGVGGAGLAWDSCVGIVPARSQHSGGVNACLADGSVRFVSNNISLLTWQRLGHMKDGQPPAPF
jgi:prepilin-type processing-associated H-X9-DG protein